MLFSYFQASTISTYDFSTLYTTLPHNLIRNQLVDLIENTFRREEALYLACNEERVFSLLKNIKKYDLWSGQKVTDALIYLLLNIVNIHFEHMVNRIYPAELQLNEANASDTEAAFLDLNLSIHNDIVSIKIYDKRNILILIL